MKRVLAMAAALGLACGGGETEDHSVSAAAAAETPVATAAVAQTASTGGAVHTVDMVLNDQAEYRFVPEELTIESGDTVRWINVSGGPHNVKWIADGIPAGAADVLAAAMEGRTLGPLEGQLMMADRAAYEISFAGAPAGVYDYTCTPHQLLGMDGKLTIQ